MTILAAVTALAVAVNTVVGARVAGIAGEIVVIETILAGILGADLAVRGTGSAGTILKVMVGLARIACIPVARSTPARALQAAAPLQKVGCLTYLANPVRATRTVLWTALANPLAQVIKGLTDIAGVTSTAGFAASYTLDADPIGPVVSSCALGAPVRVAGLAAIPTGKADASTQVVSRIAV